MVKGKRPPDAECLDKDKRLKIISGLSELRGQTKTVLARTLKFLNDEGLLVDQLSTGSSSSSYNRQIERAAQARSIFEDNMYGSLIQQRQLPHESRKYSNTLVHVSPFAFLHQLCLMNRSLYGILKGLMRQHGMLSIIVYIDGINPCDPTHPQPEKLLEATYWTITQLPNWFIRRKEGWFPFALARTKAVKCLSGEMSEFTTIILDIFFPERGTSFDRGCTIVHDDGSFVFVAKFEGFLADEKALKDIFDIKGQAGNVPCFSCLNIRNRWCTLETKRTFTEQHHWEPDLSKRKPTTHKHIVGVVSRLSDAAAAATKGHLNTLQTNSGINYNPTGLLFNHRLMNVVLGDITEKYIRDPMHTLVSKGVFGTHLACLIQAMAKSNVSLDIVQAFTARMVLPRSKGYRASDLYFQEEMLATDHVRHFASDVLGMMNIMFAFLKDKIAPRGILIEHIECFEAAYRILNSVRRGTVNDEIASSFTSTVVQYATLFLKLYGTSNAKIKFHHMFDLIWDMLRLGQFATCFPTERKNKDALAVCAATDKTIELNSIVKFLNRTLSQWEEHDHICDKAYLHNPRVYMMHDASKVKKSTHATLECGDVFEGDVVALRNGDVGKVVEFLEHDFHMFASLWIHPRLGGIYFEMEPSEIAMIEVESIVEPVFYKSATQNRLVVCVPLYCDSR